MRKARLENGYPKVYPSIPKVFEKELDGKKTTVFGYGQKPESVHYADGFRDLVIPDEYDEALHLLDEVVEDKVNDRFIYTIIDRPFDLAAKQELLLAELDQQQDFFERLISRCERIHGKDNEGLNTAINTVVQTQRKTVVAINNLTEETGRIFSIRQEDIEALKAMFDPYKF